jgi:hypothetical protein
MTPFKNCEVIVDVCMIQVCVEGMNKKSLFKGVICEDYIFDFLNIFFTIRFKRQGDLFVVKKFAAELMWDSNGFAIIK